VLIGDFGGGTTDFSLLRVSPRERIALGTTGVGLAGDAFDAKIVRYLISPALGSESMARSLNKTLPALPAWVYANLERWHTLSFLRTRPVMELLRTTAMRALEPEKIAALRSVVEHDLGYRMHQSVQRVKVDLSSQTETEFVLDAEAVHLKAPVTRAQFEGWIAPELLRMETSLTDLLDKTGTTADKIDRVFLTGGTSLVPAVRRVFTSRFGEERVVSGEAFTSVAHGLALMAANNLMRHWRRRNINQAPATSTAQRPSNKSMLARIQVEVASTKAAPALMRAPRSRKTGSNCGTT